MIDRALAVIGGLAAGIAGWFALAVIAYLIEAPFRWPAHVTAVLLGTAALVGLWPAPVGEVAPDDEGG